MNESRVDCDMALAIASTIAQVETLHKQFNEHDEHLRRCSLHMTQRLLKVLLRDKQAIPAL